MNLAVHDDGDVMGKAVGALKREEGSKALSAAERVLFGRASK